MRVSLLRACHAPCWHFAAHVLIPRQDSIVSCGREEQRQATEAVRRAHTSAIAKIAASVGELDWQSSLPDGVVFSRRLTAWARALTDDAAFDELIRALNLRSRHPGAAGQSDWALARVRQMAADWFARRCEPDLVEDMLSEWTLRVIRYFDGQPFDSSRGRGGVAANFQAFLF